MDKEIFNALRKIKEICKAQCSDEYCCRTCPFGESDGGCFLDADIPANWSLKEKFEPVKYFEVS